MNYVYFMLRLRWEWRCCCRGVVGKGVMLGIGVIISRGEGVGGGACVAMELRGGPEGRSTAPGGMRKWEEMHMCSRVSSSEGYVV